MGGATVKNSVGYGLTHALWGSQGRLGAIVELTLRLRRRRQSDDDPGETLDAEDALQTTAALVRCDDLAPGTVAPGTRLDCRERPGLSPPRTECGWLGATPSGAAAEADAAGTACRGDRGAGGAGGQPGEGLGGDSDGAGGAGSGGGVCLEVTGPYSDAVIYVKLLGLMRPGRRQTFVAGAGCPVAPLPPDRVRGQAPTLSRQESNCVGRWVGRLYSGFPRGVAQPGSAHRSGR